MSEGGTFCFSKIMITETWRYGRTWNQITGIYLGGGNYQGVLAMGQVEPAGKI